MINLISNAIQRIIDGKKRTCAKNGNYRIVAYAMVDTDGSRFVRVDIRVSKDKKVKK